MWEAPTWTATSDDISASKQMPRNSTRSYHLLKARAGASMGHNNTVFTTGDFQVPSDTTTNTDNQNNSAAVDYRSLIGEIYLRPAPNPGTVGRNQGSQTDARIPRRSDKWRVLKHCVLLCILIGYYFMFVFPNW
ncbi:hypothetical protein BsWGS_21357 [Bradybaena similaris]